MFATQAQAFYKTPESHGGCGSSTSSDYFTLNKLGEWIGFGAEDTGDDIMETGNGSFTMELDGAVISIQARGNERGVDPLLELDFSDVPATVELTLSAGLSDV